MCSALFYMYQFMVRVSPNIMNGELLANFCIDSAGLGILLGAYNWAYAGMQLPLGITIDRFGPRIFLCAAALLCASSCFLFGHTTHPIVGGAARFMMGMGSACGLISTIKLGTLWLPPKHVAKVTGMALLMGTAGASLGGAPLEMVLHRVGFTRTMEVLGCIGLGVAVLTFFLVNNHPTTNQPKEAVRAGSHEHPLTDLALLIKTPQTWILATYGMLMYLPITAIGVVWGVSFVKSIAGVSEAVAASVVSTLFFGAALGSPFFAYYSDFTKSRRLPMVLGALVTTVLWLVIITCQLPLYLLYALFFLAGFAYTSKSLSFAAICELMPLKMSALAVAFLNAIVMCTGVIFLPIIGALIDMHWNGKTIDNVPLYTPEDYRFALLIIPILLAASCVITIFMKETHPEKQINQERDLLMGDDVL